MCQPDKAVELIIYCRTTPPRNYPGSEPTSCLLRTNLRVRFPINLAKAVSLPNNLWLSRKRLATL
jgi:hypothetical protein